MAVSNTVKVRRDADSSANNYSEEKEKMPLFARILDEQIEEQQVAPRECHTVTYGQDCLLRNFRYQQREYHY